MRVRATAAAAAEAARAHDADHARAAERAYFAQRSDGRRGSIRPIPSAARDGQTTELPSTDEWRALCRWA
ncbi:hypothetical protein MSG28_000117 [Choristoneura fumiferana]|uniref:Uncharacterized protein n=1 Tax=Choristoneura fumiferana TaxID=7141 RepID=A0ACC0JZL0_CHOFU|nr:hypothetical protein MSG28_000117 [Choristoneura fumiferana]